MLAFQLHRDPGALRGPEPLFEEDPDSGLRREIPKHEAERLYVQTSSLVAFLYDLYRGLASVSLSEYNRLPARLVDARRVFETMMADADPARIPPKHHRAG